MFGRRSILFVRERGEKEAEDDSEREKPPLLTLTGSEAKQFYEDVLSMPEEVSTVKSRVKRKRKRPNTNRKEPTKKQLRPPPTTVNQVFGYVQEGDLDRVQEALTDGVCDVNTRDQFQWTLLMSAAHAGHTHIVEYLLSMGAEWRNTVDKSGHNAVDLARSAGHISLACNIESHRPTTSRESALSSSSQSGYKDTLGRTNSSKTYFCEVCQQRVTERSSERHETSTVHQFSCDHPKIVHSSYSIPHTNRGFQMMLRSGWNPAGGLGCEQEGRKYPVKTILKQDRLGFGQNEEGPIQAKAKVTHFAAFDERAVKRRSERFEKRQFTKKKDILAAVKKDKQWEVRIRRYLNSDETTILS